VTQNVLDFLASYHFSQVQWYSSFSGFFALNFALLFYRFSMQSSSSVYNFKVIVLSVRLIQC